MERGQPLPKLNVGVIGAGFMRHAGIYAGLPDVALVGVADPREAVAREVPARTEATPASCAGQKPRSPAGPSRLRTGDPSR